MSVLVRTARPFGQRPAQQPRPEIAMFEKNTKIFFQTVPFFAKRFQMWPIQIYSKLGKEDFFREVR